MKQKSKYKVLIVSDSHGSDVGIRQAIEIEKPIDLLIHCGDMEHDVRAELRLDYNFDVECVTGNCDYLLPPEPEKFIKIGYFNILIIHGHELDVKRSNESVLTYAKLKGADVVLYGHSHVPEIDSRFGVLMINPGSITLPRQITREKTYAVLTITDDSMPSAVIRRIR